MTPNTHRHRTTAVRALLAAGPVLVLCSLVLTGCGSSKGASPSATTTTTATTTTVGAADFAAYQSCLQSHGVTLPQGRPTGGTGGTPPAGGQPSLTKAQQEALDACADLRPTAAGAGGFGPGGGFSPGGANSDNPAFAKFQRCLKQHGVDPTNADARGSSDFQEAMTACRSLLPDQGAGGPNFGGGAPPSSGGGQGNSAAFAKFQACLKSHGVNTTASNQSPAKTQAALSACQKLLPATGAGTQTTPATSG